MILEKVPAVGSVYFNKALLPSVSLNSDNCCLYMC
jgi:hypothetical protein